MIMPSHYPFVIILLLTSPVLYCKVTIFSSIFSDNQTFWNTNNTDSNFSIGILPVNTIHYKESIPCDSCHRLSPDGVHFSMENFFLQMVKLLSRGEPKLIIPENDLVKGLNIGLLGTLDSLNFPLDKWFDNFEFPIIYRDSDPFTSTAIKKHLNRTGGALGHTHLLIPYQLDFKIFPSKRNDHFGDINYKFYLIFWNVKLAYPEWVISYEYMAKNQDLDAPLEKSLEENLTVYLKNLPEKVKKHRAEEPR